MRLKDAGVNTLPGTAAEILDQDMRDKISPGRISVNDWINVIKTAHKLGINSTSTIMFGHIETPEDRVKHIAKIREIQKETGGFTEFVPLNFIHSEAPMYRHELHEGIRNGASANEVLLTHAISRIMLNNHINNIQMSWVKEGPKMAQVLLMWGANDFGQLGIGTRGGRGRDLIQRLRAGLEQLSRFVRALGGFPGNPHQLLAAALQGIGDVFRACRRLLRDVDQIMRLVMENVARFARARNRAVRCVDQIFCLAAQAFARRFGFQGCLIQIGRAHV